MTLSPRYFRVMTSLPRFARASSGHPIDPYARIFGGAIQELFPLTLAGQPPPVTVNGQNPRDRSIALCYASERFGLFCYGNFFAQIQDTVPLHLECE